MINPGLLINSTRNCSAIGLEIGDTSIKMAQLQKTAEGWVIKDMIMQEIARSDSDKGLSRKEAVIESINNGLKSSSLSGKSVVSVMPGYQLDIFSVKISVSEEEEMDAAIMKEAAAHLSYDTDDAVIDYLTVDSEGSGHESAGSTRALIIAARREDVDEYLSILKGAKLKPIALDISASAISRATAITVNGFEKNALVVNAGGLHTTLTLIRRNNILLDRNISWGREDMLEKLMQMLKLDRERANGLINRIGLGLINSDNAGAPADKDVHAAKISETVYEIVEPQLEKLAKEIDKVLQYFSSEMRGATIDVLYLTGAIGSIKALDAYLEQRTGIQAKYFNPLDTLRTGDQLNTNKLNGYGSLFSIALGLAMRGLDSRDLKPEKQ